MNRVMGSVYITDYIRDPIIEKKILGDLLTDEFHSEIQVLLVWHADINKTTIDSLPNLKGIVRYGVGYDNINFNYATKKEIYVCNTPDYGTEEVADTTLAMMLSLTRGTIRYDSMARTFKDESWQENTLPGIKRLSGLTLGILGCGRIGSSVALRAKAFGMAVIFYDPYQPSGYEKVLGVQRSDSTDDVLSTSDILSIHVPLTEETHGLIDEQFVESMKNEAILINTSRGKVLRDLDFLYDFLKKGKLAAVGLDVLPEEPPNDCKLLDAWRKREPWLEGRLIINPHTAYYSEEAFDEMRRKAAQNALRIIKGIEPLNILNRTVNQTILTPA